MAKRENQGMQIGLIVCIVMIVLLMVTSVLFWKKADEAAKAAEQAQEAASVARLEADQSRQENQELRTMLGFAPDTALSEVQKSRESDMQLFASSFPEDKRNYHELAGYLFGELNKKNAQLADASAKEIEAKRALEEVRKSEADKTAQAEEQARRAADDLNKLRAEFIEDRQKLASAQEATKASGDKQVQTLSAQVKEQTDKITALEKDVTTLRTIREDLSTKLQDATVETMDVPSGKVIFASHRQDTVWIDRGSADGLREQMTFTVFDLDDTNPARSAKKGSIEVTRILDAHTAEARIVDEQPANPIITGDQIFTPLWRPGEHLHFAIVGKIDIDGDKQSDRQRLRELIHLNGGVIDAEVDEDGKRTGRLSVNTRYLIRGEGDGPEVNAALKQAQQLGIQWIAPETLMAKMSYQAAQRTLTLTKGSGSQSDASRTGVSSDRRSATDEQGSQRGGRAARNAP